MQDKYEALAELLKDEAAAKAVMGSSPEEAQANLKAKGLDFTVEELEQLAAYTLSSAQDKNELDESALDDVSGGIYFPAVMPSSFPAIAKVLSTVLALWKKK